MATASVFDKQATIELICARLAEGNSLRKICRELDMAESTARQWLATDPEAHAQSVRARELGCDALADECLEIADDLVDKPEDRRIRIDTRLRLIGKWSQRYGDKVKVEQTTTVTHTYDYDNCDPRELEQLETTLAKLAGSSGSAGTA